jgi:hypothetical protein
MVMRSSAQSKMQCPSSQGSVQKSVADPPPTMHLIEALKNALVTASSLNDRPAHDLDLS